MLNKELTYTKTVKDKLFKQPFYVTKRMKDKLRFTVKDYLRMTVRQPTLPQDAVNAKDIRVIGLRRTGNHAIINWIEKQQPGRVEHLNNLPLTWNPFAWKYVMLRDYAPKRFCIERANLWRQIHGYFVRKDCLIRSYEDYPITKVTSSAVKRKHDFYFGKSSCKYDVLILRDPFNLIASRLKNDMLPVKSFTRSVIDVWLEYAKEFLEETHYLSNRKVVINYNRWVQDWSYRWEIARQLDLPFTDEGVDDVRPQGGGSSFDGREFVGRGTQMDVTGRWKKFANHTLFRALVRNDELLDYSNRIFGSIPGTEILMDGDRP